MAKAKSGGVAAAAADPATPPPYQIIPPLSVEDYAALKTDVAARGVQVPLEYDDEGNIIDGHHRERICIELGIKDWPRIVRSYPDEASKRTQARKLNLARRHLDSAAKRALIEQELIDNPKRSNRQIAAELGVSHPTVAEVRNEAEATGKVFQLDKTVGKDGRERTTSPARPAQETARVAAETAAEQYLETEKPTLSGLRAVIREAVDQTVGSKPTGVKPRAPDPLATVWIDWVSAVEKLSKVPSDFNALANRIPALRTEHLTDARAALNNLNSWIKALEGVVVDDAA